MRVRTAVAALMLIPVAASTAFASFSGGSSGSTPMPSSSSDAVPSSAASTPRQEAERLYGDAFADVTKAKEDLAAGKAKNAEKKLRRALDHGQQAVGLDSTYHEAWNLIGFTERKLGDYPHALAAYDRCLRIKPDYIPAREYLGEAYLETGDLAKANEQLAWLEKLEATDQVALLKHAIDAYAAAHPDRAAAPASSDSTTSAAAPGGEH